MAVIGNPSYYIKIGSCTFNNPPIKREGYKCSPRLVQTADSERVASGLAIVKPLPHKPSKLYVTFPVMTPDQFRYYCQAIRGTLTGEDEMHLTIEYWDDERGAYSTGTFYHTDLTYTPVIYSGKRMIVMDEIRFVEL